MSLLVNFYRGESRDAEGRFLEEILAWNDDDLEEVHNFVQWLFPLPEPSQFNPDAPLLINEDMAEFRADPLLRGNLRKSFERILPFLGLAIADGKVVDGPNFSLRVPEVWAIPNHNWLRISRILRSLTLLGLKTEAMALFGRLDAIYSSRKFPITAETFNYWDKAVKCDR
jgi:hypothetical protein